MEVKKDNSFKEAIFHKKKILVSNFLNIHLEEKNSIEKHLYN